MKTRKNFNLDTELVEKFDKICKEEKRSMTKGIEMLMSERVNRGPKDEFFKHMDKRHRNS